MHYFATDGNYGDAEELLVINTEDFTPEDWKKIAEEEWNRAETAREIWRSKKAGNK